MAARAAHQLLARGEAENAPRERACPGAGVVTEEGGGHTQPGFWGVAQMAVASLWPFSPFRKELSLGLKAAQRKDCKPQLPGSWVRPWN